MFKKLRKNKKGFTLIEIIVVIVILAVLMAVAVPSVLKYINEADNAKFMAEARAVMTTAQAEVVKQNVTENGLTADELKALLGAYQKTDGKNIASYAGVENCEVVALYSGTIEVNDKTAEVTIADGADGKKFDKDYTDTEGKVSKPELKAVEMTLGTDKRKVVAVINDKVYVEEK